MRWHYGINYLTELRVRNDYLQSRHAFEEEYNLDNPPSPLFLLDKTVDKEDEIAPSCQIYKNGVDNVTKYKKVNYHIGEDTMTTSINSTFRFHALFQEV